MIERRQYQHRLVRQRSLEGLGRSLKAAPNARRQADSLGGPLDRLDGVARANAWREIERKRDGGELPLTADRQAASVVSLTWVNTFKRHLPTADGPHIDVLQRPGLFLKLRHHFEHHTVLIQLGKHRRHLPLAEGVIQRIVISCGVMPNRDAVLRSMTSMDASPLILLIAADVAQLGQGLQGLHQLGRPPVQLVGIRILQRVLILRAADAVFHREILHRLHEQSNPVRPRPSCACSRSDDVAGVDPRSRTASG